ncbi:MAG: YdcF family protein [Clostridia bacterium]|nr:YdcF family protein [Clostridia bacterium]
MSVKLSETNVDEMSLEMLHRLIFPEAKGIEIPHCQAALVLGTSQPNPVRTSKGVECYKKGMCDKLAMSGGVFWDTEYGHVTEAECMKRYAMDHGVPESDIILDNLARTTIENMICGVVALHRAFHYISEVKDLIIITSEYHMRRSMLAAQATMPRFMRLYAVPGKGTLCAERWTETEHGIECVRDEARYIKAMVVHGMVPDIEF